MERENIGRDQEGNEILSGIQQGVEWKNRLKSGRESVRSWTPASHILSRFFPKAF
jgi:hypothetical protein